ncbi:MAG: hypothetical protein K2K70_08370 [Lachnospiraceae bacterium]|nr:hypothetical protein [Lachnospiraceae bacterium]
MEHLPVPEKSDSHRKGIRLVGEIMEKRMEKGNFSLILAVLLPLICIAIMPVVTIMNLAGLAIYELLLIAGVAWGTKKYYLLYSFPGKKYPIEVHIVIIVLCGLGAAAMVLIPSRWYLVVIIWVLSLIISMARQLLAGQQESLWAGFAIEFAMAIRAGYLVFLLICLFIKIVVFLLMQL